MDSRSGRPVNANLAEYHIPVNVDVPAVEAILVEEHDAPRERARYQRRGRNRDHGYRGCGRECSLVCDRNPRAQIPITLDPLIESQV